MTSITPVVVSGSLGRASALHTTALDGPREASHLLTLTFTLSDCICGLVGRLMTLYCPSPGLCCNTWCLRACRLLPMPRLRTLLQGCVPCTGHLKLPSLSMVLGSFGGPPLSRAFGGLHRRMPVDLDQLTRGAHATQVWTISHVNASSFLFCSNESAIVKSSLSYRPN